MAWKRVWQGGCVVMGIGDSEDVGCKHGSGEGGVSGHGDGRVCG